MFSVLLQESDKSSSSLSAEAASAAHCSLDSSDLRKKTPSYTLASMKTGHKVADFAM